ncbi:Emp24/gp25L/p24 family/GOLD family protein [Pelomyxa schiedti]|nr:Emp24/gp25L/p24 family/GOLD family protein [Pelomyxa schiedti]
MQLAPITREYLRAYYTKYPVKGLPNAADEEHSLILDETIATLKAALVTHDGANTGTTAVLAGVEKLCAMDPPHKMDTNLFECRCMLEEIMEMYNSRNVGAMEGILKTGSAQAGVPFDPAVQWGQSSQVASTAQTTLAAIEKYQKDCVVAVESLIKTFMPQDWRASIVAYTRQRSEDRCTHELEELTKTNPSIQAKYDLMWQHQMARRQSLVNLGNMSGVFKALVCYIGGVPQCLFDFIKTVNDEQGPMEEYRVTYGVYQYWLTRYIRRIKVLLTLIYCCVTVVTRAKTLPPQAVEAMIQISVASLPKAVEALQHLLAAYKPFLDLLLTVLQNSPFFLTKQALDALNCNNGKPMNILVSTNHDFRVTMQAGDSLAWEFTTDRDIKFSATFEIPAASAADSPKTLSVFPLGLVRSNTETISGHYTATAPGSIILFWDNSYSWLNKKNLTLKVNLTQAPPSTTPTAPPTATNIEPEFSHLLEQVVGAQDVGSSTTTTPTSTTASTCTTTSAESH